MLQNVQMAITNEKINQAVANTDKKLHFSASDCRGIMCIPSKGFDESPNPILEYLGYTATILKDGLYDAGAYYYDGLRAIGGFGWTALTGEPLDFQYYSEYGQKVQSGEDLTAYDYASHMPVAGTVIGLYEGTAATYDAGVNQGNWPLASATGTVTLSSIVLPGRAKVKVNGVPGAKVPNTTQLGRGETLRQKYSHLTPSERKVRLDNLLEEKAFNRLKALENSIPGAHFVEKHGAQSTLASQLDRVQFAKNPTTGVVETWPIGKLKKPSSATRFLTHRDQWNAIQRSQIILRNTGDVTLAERPIKFQNIIGEGYKKDGLQYGQSYSGQVWYKSGQVTTAFPIWGQ